MSANLKEEEKVVKNLCCRKCGEPVPPYLYAINYYHSSVIWVNAAAKIVPCPKCGADVRQGNATLDSSAARG